MFKFPFIKVPDFQKEALEEVKPAYFNKLTQEDKDEYVRGIIQQRMSIWACRTAASAFNLGVLVVMVLIMTNGLQLLGFAQKFITHLTGIK